MAMPIKVKSGVHHHVGDVPVHKKLSGIGSCKFVGKHPTSAAVAANDDVFHIKHLHGIWQCR